MGIGVEKIIVLAVIAMFLVGPERLPDYAQRLGRFVRAARRMLDDAKDRVREEMGPDFDEDEWRKLDPRQYDPRRIIRDALLEPPTSKREEADRGSEPDLLAEPVPVEVAPRQQQPRLRATFDDEAT